MQTGTGMISDTKIPVLLLAVAMLLGCGQPSGEDAVADHAAEADDLRKQVAAKKADLDDVNSEINELLLELGSDAGPSVVGSYRSVPEIIEELMELKINSSNRRSARRRLGFLFESIAGQGKDAVPHISKFLDRMDDVDFDASRSEKDMARDIDYWRSRMVNVPLDFETPPSLRIGLIDILAEIGGSEAEAAIANVLASTGRGFEVAYSAKKLRDLAGRDAYRDEALGAAHELLADPIAFDGGNKYDAASRQYLFMVLEMYQDKTFIETAQEMFVKEDGRIDRSVLRYFEQVGREHAIQSVAQAMRSGELRDDEMMQLTQVAVQSMGRNDPQGDSLFRDIMTSDKYSLDVKMQTIRSMDDIDEPELLRSRLDLMSTIQYGEDDIMGRASEIYSGRVESKLAKRDFGDDKRYDAMHNDFRKIRDQARREQRTSGARPAKGPGSPTIITGRPGG